jgi:hypothetical protein
MRVLSLFIVTDFAKVRLYKQLDHTGIVSSLREAKILEQNGAFVWGR